MMMIKSLFCLAVFASSAASKLQGPISQAAYYNLHSDQMDRCHGGVLAAILRALELIDSDDMSELSALFGQFAPDDKAATTKMVQRIAQVVVRNDSLGDPEKVKEILGSQMDRAQEKPSGLVRTRRSADPSLFESDPEDQCEVKDDSLKEKQMSPKINVKDIGLKTIPHTPISVQNNIAEVINSVVRGLLNFLQEPSRPLLKRRRLEQAPGGMADLLAARAGAFAHLLSSTWITLVDDLFNYSISTNSLSYRGTSNTVANALCHAADVAWTHKANREEHLCSLEKAYFAFLQCSSDQSFAICSNEDSVTLLLEQLYFDPDECAFYNVRNDSFYMVDIKTKPVYFDFPDYRENRGQNPPAIPNTFPEVLWKAEGSYYYLLMKAAFIASIDTLCVHPCNLDETKWPLINNYVTEFSLFYQPVDEPNEKSGINRGIVSAFMLRANHTDLSNAQKCQRVLIVRSTSTSAEWAVNLDTYMIPFIVPNVTVANGINMFTNQVFLGLVRAWRDAGTLTECPKLNLVISGHSLGGIVSMTLSMLIKSIFPEISVTSIQFAAANVLNDEGVKLYSELVNVRNIAAKTDAITQMQCTDATNPHGVASCHNRDPTTSKWFHYADNIGKIEFDTDDIVKNYNLSDTWFNLNLTQLKLDVNIPSNVQFLIHHSCTYACKTSMACSQNPAPDKNWYCDRCFGTIQNMSIDLSSFMPAM